MTFYSYYNIHFAAKTAFLSNFSLWSEISLELREELEFLVSLVRDDSGISIIWEVSVPLYEGSAVVCHSLQYDLALNAGNLMGWLSWEDLIADWVSKFTNFIDSQLPLGSISVNNFKNWVDLSSWAWSEWGTWNLAWNDLLKLEWFEQTPSLVDVDWDDWWLWLVAWNWDGGSLSVKFFNHLLNERFVMKVKLKIFKINITNFKESSTYITFILL